MTSRGPRLAIVGDFNPDFAPHPKTNEAIAHACDHLGLPVRADWIPSAELAGRAGARLSGYDGVWIAPGSPYRSMDGALDAIRFGREAALPLLGTCGGCQYALIEYARNVLGIVDAQHAEHAQAHRMRQGLEGGRIGDDTGDLAGRGFHGRSL